MTSLRSGSGCLLYKSECGDDVGLAKHATVYDNGVLTSQRVLADFATVKDGTAADVTVCFNDAQYVAD